MGRNGHDKTISQFTRSKVTDKVEKLYLELIARKGASQHEEVQGLGRTDRARLAESRGRGSSGGRDPEASGGFKGSFLQMPPLAVKPTDWGKIIIMLFLVAGCLLLYSPILLAGESTEGACPANTLPFYRLRVEY